MAQLFNEYFLALVIGSMLVFILVVTSLAIEDAVRKPRD